MIFNKHYEIKAYAQDPDFFKESELHYANSYMQDMAAKPYLNNLEKELGIDKFQTVSIKRYNSRK